MPIFGKKEKPGEEPAKKPQEEYVICPHCYVDYSVEQIRKAGGVCPSCKGKIDLEKIPRARL